jgi:hypothetical protein
MTTLRIKMTNLFRASVMPSKNLPDHHSAPHKIGNKSSHKGLVNLISIATDSLPLVSPTRLPKCRRLFASLFGSQEFLQPLVSQLFWRQEVFWLQTDNLR